MTPPAARVVREPATERPLVDRARAAAKGPTARPNAVRARAQPAPRRAPAQLATPGAASPEDQAPRLARVAVEPVAVKTWGEPVQPARRVAKEAPATVRVLARPASQVAQVVRGRPRSGEGR